MMPEALRVWTWLIFVVQRNEKGGGVEMKISIWGKLR